MLWPQNPCHYFGTDNDSPMSQDWASWLLLVTYVEEMKSLLISGVCVGVCTGTCVVGWLEGKRGHGISYLWFQVISFTVSLLEEYLNAIKTNQPVFIYFSLKILYKLYVDFFKIRRHIKAKWKQL